MLIVSSVVPFSGSPTLWPSSWSARGCEMVAARHTCFGLEKALVVLKGVMPFGMDSSYCISAGSCEEGKLRKK